MGTPAKDATKLPELLLRSPDLVMAVTTAGTGLGGLGFVLDPWLSRGFWVYWRFVVHLFLCMVVFALCKPDGIDITCIIGLIIKLEFVVCLGRGAGHI